MDFDVIQVGFGPVGQTNAALIGQRGHSVGVFERWPTVYPLPRAGHIDHEIMRIFQGIGAAEHVERHAIPIPDYDWINGEGTLLLHMDWNQPTPSSWKSDYLMYQPYMEDALMAAVGRAPSVEVNLGWEATAVRQFPDHVEVDFRQGAVSEPGRWEPTGQTRTVTGRYLIGADGAGSFVRSSVGIDWIDYGFAEDWLVLDVRPHEPDLEIDMPEAGQICDPARPVSLFRRLGREHARWEFMLLPGETAAQMSTAENAWKLLSRWGLGPHNAAVIRRAVYTFRSLIADGFRRDRVLLVGDAGHLMPPFMGQGMCSGVRDAANLAWKLDLVLRGAADDALLDAYTTERHPHVDQIIKTSMALGQVVCISDPAAAAARDEAFLTGQVPPPPPFPWITSGILAGDGADGVVGRLGVQGRISDGEVTGLADDLLGAGWTLISPHKAVLDGLSDAHRSVLDRVGARSAHISWANFGAGSFLDLDSTYSKWFAELGAVAVIVRPDFYVYGVAADAAALGALIDTLDGQVPAVAGEPVEA